MKLTSTNRPFGLIIKLSQTVFEKAVTNLQFTQLNCTPLLPQEVRFRVELVMPALNSAGRFAAADSVDRLAVAQSVVALATRTIRRPGSVRGSQVSWWSYREGHPRPHPEHGS